MKRFFLAILLILFLPCAAKAAIVYDNSAAGNNTGNNVSFSITIGSGANNAVVVYANSAGSPATTVTVGGVTAVQTGSNLTWSAGVLENCWVAKGVPTGAQTVSITSSSSTVIQGLALSFSGVSQITPVDKAATSTNGVGASATLGITPTANNAMITTGLFTFLAGGTATATNNTTSKITATSGSFDLAGGIDGPVTPVSARTEGWSFSSTTWGLMVMSLNPTGTVPLLSSLGAGS